MRRILSSILLGCALCVGFAGTATTADHTDGLIVIDEVGRAVIRLPPLTRIQEVLWSGDPLVRPTDAILEPDGSLVIIDPGAKALFRFDPAEGDAPVRVGSFEVDSCWNARFNDTELLLSGPGGLTLFDLATGDETRLPTALVDPFDVTIGSDGQILVADPGASALISVDPVTFEGTAFSTPFSSCWVSIAPGGQVVAAGPDGVFLVDAAGGEPKLLSEGGMLVDPTAMAFGGHGAVVYVADRGARAVIEVDLQTGAQTLIASGGALQEPVALLVIQVPAPTFSIDHFSVYRAAGPEPPPSFQVVKLRDQFNEELVKLGALDLFLTPADKNGEGLKDRISHLACNPILDGTPGFPEVIVTNQFGVAKLGVGIARELCVPTEKLITPGAVKIDHFKCYEANGEPVEAVATLVDQFQGWGGHALDPFLLCNPVDKNEEGIVNFDDHLVCYSVTPTGQSLGVEVPIANQIYPEVDIAVFEPFALCVPSKKQLPEPGLLASLASGVLGLAALARWRRRGRRVLGAS